MKSDIIQILLADDHAILRDGIKSLLNKENDMDVVGEADNGDEALQKARKLKPDVVIMDISMPNMNGLEATKEILRFVNTKVVLLSMHTDEQYVARAIDVGVSGYLDKQSAASVLISAVRSVNNGMSYFSPSITKTALEAATGKLGYEMDSSLKKLTKRERQVLQLIAEGETADKIAKTLFISVSTYYKHRQNLMKKLGMNNVADLTRFAVDNQIVSE